MRLALTLFALFLVNGCVDRRVSDEPLRCGAYLWQRQWTPAVIESLARNSNQLDRIIVLGGEIEWDRAATEIVRSNIDWPSLARLRSAAIAVRVTARTRPQNIEQFPLAVVRGEFDRLLEEAKQNSVNVPELQLDFDCDINQLRGYAGVIETLRSTTRPARLSLTTLPSWLGSPHFRQLIDHCDSYVLQMHSIPLRGGSAAWKLCDTQLAQRSAIKAAALKQLFSVALPTYRCVAGYSPAGNLLGVTMDSVIGCWPPDTRLREVGADADELADLVHKWKSHHPSGMKEILWYRLPVENDARNWRWPTFSAVISGRKPKHQLDVVSEGSNPVDIAIRNRGEADERTTFRIVATSQQPASDGDALHGCTVKFDGKETVFATVGGETFPLRPGETRSVGWLRFSEPTAVRLELLTN